MTAKRPANDAPYAYEGLDRVIHERARLSVLTSLLTHPKGLNFNELKQLCALTDGNLSRHLKVLEQAKLVEIIKSTDRNRPITLCRMSATGRKQYLEYLTTLEQVIRDAARGARGEAELAILRELAPSES
jgi:DNA-binding MarR family transcriptional regulator